MTDDEMKYNLFMEIWSIYKEMELTLIQAGISIKRLPKNEKLLEELENIPLNKMRHGKHWITNFVKTVLNPYKKIRAENTEEYWEKAKMMKWGNEFTEIRELNKAKKLILESWFVSSNPLVLKPRVQPNA
jgi:hypothetical protein